MEKAKNSTTGEDIRTRSGIETHNPIDYISSLDSVPETWIDHYDGTPRRIRCVSDGRQEKLYIKSNPQNVDFYDTDDILYYLDAALSDGRLWGKEDCDDETGEPCIKNPANVEGKPVLLEEGKEYTLKKAGIDWDTDMGLVWINEIGNDYGFPAFLFEELGPVSAEKRRQSFEKWGKDLREKGRG